ncbi:MAG: hemolysin family protein [Thermodesulfobacteriota bacterium]
MTILIVAFLLAVLVSFTCSLVEAVILSLSPATVALLMEEGRRSGNILQSYKGKIDRPLSAILTLNTVANTVGAAVVGAQAQAVFGSQWIAFFSALLTVIILVFSEIIPKTVGAVFCKELAPAVAYIIKGLVTVTYPLVLIFEALARLIKAKAPRTMVTREEMVMTAEMSRAEGQLQDREGSIIRNLLHLDQIDVRDVMTPRSVLFALSQEETVGEAIRLHVPIRFSRIPIYGRDLDDITGLVRRYQINQACSQGQNETSLKALANPIHAVPEAMTVAAALDEFIKRREQLFLVVDEYGGTAGIITLEDAIETLLGVEIVDELDSVVDMRKHALEQWEKIKKARGMEFESPGRSEPREG